MAPRNFHPSTEFTFAVTCLASSVTPPAVSRVSGRVRGILAHAARRGQAAARPGEGPRAIDGDTQASGSASGRDAGSGKASGGGAPSDLPPGIGAFLRPDPRLCS
jgi:hypothetical protein